jgi:hypothetical protein
MDSFQKFFTRLWRKLRDLEWKKSIEKEEKNILKDLNNIQKLKKKLKQIIWIYHFVFSKRTFLPLFRLFLKQNFKLEIFKKSKNFWRFKEKFWKLFLIKLDPTVYIVKITKKMRCKIEERIRGYRYRKH